MVPQTGEECKDCAETAHAPPRRPDPQHLRPVFRLARAAAILLESLLLAGSAAAEAAESGIPPSAGTEPSPEPSAAASVLRETWEPPRAADSRRLAAVIQGMDHAVPVDQALQLPGLLGGRATLKFERGGLRLPDWETLRTGSRESFGRAAGSQRLEFILNGSGAAGGTKLAAHWLRLKGSRSGGEHLELSLESGRLKASGLRQELAAGVRPGQDLTAADRKLLGGEVGMRRSDLSLDYKTGPKAALALQETRLAIAGAGAQRQRFAFEGHKNLSLALETGRVDGRFDRAGTLGEAEKALFTRERGFRWQELTAKLRASDWASLESTRYRSRGEDGKRERSHERMLWTLTPSRTSKILLLQDQATQQDRPGASQATATRSLQWEQRLSSGINFRATRESVKSGAGRQSRTRTRQAWNLGSDPKSSLQWSVGRETIDDPAGRAATLSGSFSGSLAAKWKLQGQYARSTVPRARSRTTYQTSLTGALARRWQLAAVAAAQMVSGTRLLARKQALVLTGADGILGGRLRKTHLSVALSAAGGVPMVLVQMAKRPRSPKSPPKPSNWSSVSVLSETDLKKSLLTLGFQSYHLTGGDVGGPVFWWRSTGKGTLQWELRKNWVELNEQMLVPRERVAVSCQWGKSRLTAASELNPETVPGKPAIGRRQSQLEFQTQVGDTSVGVAYGTTEDLVKEAEAISRRIWVETTLPSKGSLRVTYENNDSSGPAAPPGAAVPDQSIGLSVRQEVSPDCHLNLQAEFRTWDNPLIHDDVTWRLDLLTTF